LENILTNKILLCEYNNLILSNIDNVFTYLKNIENIYIDITEFLFYDKYKKVYDICEYYLLDFKTLMVQKNIDEIYYYIIRYNILNRL
jgi:hypothetical protein